MQDRLTLDEIQSRFDSEWVLVADPELDEHLNVVRDTVVWHSKDREEVYQKAAELKPKHSAFLYTGRMPADAVIVV
jgi:hypothetical protein